MFKYPVPNSLVPIEIVPFIPLPSVAIEDREEVELCGNEENVDARVSAMVSVLDGVNIDYM